MSKSLPRRDSTELAEALLQGAYLRSSGNLSGCLFKYFKKIRE